MDVMEVARQLADETLFPAALETDRADTLPVELLDRLAEAGLYGISGPAADGGLGADFETICEVVELLSSGCLTTAFVWAQHIGAVWASSMSQNEAIRSWIGPLCRGERRAGLALGGALAGAAPLRASPKGEGWTFSGFSPFVSGWKRIDVIHTAARTEDGRLVWAFLDAKESERLRVARLDLVALNATATVRAEFLDYPVPGERVTSVVPYQEGPPPPEVLRIHASLALGVVRRCLQLMGPTTLLAEAEKIRAELDRLDPTTIQEARALVGELALRASAALAVATGSRSLILSEHAQRLAREALFVLVYALRPASREAVLEKLAARPPLPP